MRKMEKSEKEIRSTQGLELRAEEQKDSRTICGYAIRFEEESLNLGFYETIKRGAITQEYIDTHDIFCYFDHDNTKVLARSINGAGTLHLEVRDDGVYYEFECPKTTIGDELISHLERKEMFGSSFCFSLNPDKSGEQWEKRDDGTYHRTITKIAELWEVSPVFEPAYPTTTASLRNKTAEIEKFDQLVANLDNKIQQIEELAAYNNLTI